MIALIGNLIVKACLAIGVIILSAGVGVVGYGGIYLAKDKLQSKPPSVLKSEFEKSWATPTPTPEPTPTTKPTIKTPSLVPQPKSTPSLAPQPKSMPSPVINKVPVFLVHNSLTVYCPEENVDAVKTASQRAKEEQDKSTSCYIKNRDELYSCYGRCTQTMDDKDCVNYWDIYAGSFDECLDNMGQEYQKCNDDCRSWKETLDKTCSSNYYTDYVNSLITSLCK